MPRSWCRISRCGSPSRNSIARSSGSRAACSACGLKPGERIGIWAPNCAEWVLTMFAAARAGLVLVNINPAYRTTELEFALRLVGCRALVFAPRFRSSDYAQMLLSLIPELRDCRTRAACGARPSRSFACSIQSGRRSR